MATINRPGLGRVGSSSSTSGSGRMGDLVVGLVGFAVGLPLAVLLVVLLAYFASYVLVDLVSVKVGLIAAWGVLVSVNRTVQAVAPLVGESLLGGVITGSVVGVAYFFRRWREDHHQWAIEALFSQEALTALRYGIACLALHVTISVFASWLISLAGACWPWPVALGGHGGALVVAGALAVGGGFGGPGGWDPAAFAFTMVFVILLACFLAAIAICLSYSGVALLLIVIGEAALRGGVAGGSIAAAGVLMRSVFKGRSSSRDDWWAGAVSTGILTGAANSLVYLVIVFVGGALGGREYIPAN